jgi:hypothetical protein
MKFGAKRDPPASTVGCFFAPNFIQNLYSVEKKIVGISQYAYLSSLAILCTGTVYLRNCHQ